MRKIKTKIKKYFYNIHNYAVILGVITIAIGTVFLVNAGRSLTISRAMSDPISYGNDIRAQEVICYLRINNTGQIMKCGVLGCLLPDDGFCSHNDCYCSDCVAPVNSYSYYEVDLTCRHANGSPKDEHDIADHPYSDFSYLRNAGMTVM